MSAAAPPPGTKSSTAVQLIPPPASSTWQLPVELLLQCLMAADMSTRIRASHICRTWREVALAERRLWDTFTYTEYRNPQHEAARFSLFQTLLLRSQPLPFHLRVPHNLDELHFHYEDLFFDLKAFDIQRIAAYHGPAPIFEQLKPSRDILPNLVSLDFLDPDDSEPYSSGVQMDGEFASRFLPNLQQLSAPSVRFPADGTSFLALQSITLAYIPELRHRALLAHCPNLVRFDVADGLMGTPLPDPPVPPSLREISISCVRPRALDVAALLRHWHGVHIPRFTVREVYSLQGVLPLFLASHSQTIEMRLPRGGVGDTVLTSGPDDSIWTLSPSPPWAADFLASIEKPTSARLTSISVAFSRLGELLRAQLHAPGLEGIEIILGGATPSESAPSPVLGGDELFLRAPALRRLKFNFDNEYAHSCSAFFEIFQGALATLRESFRALIQYDAELLDVIMVSQQIELDCAGFAHLAKEYISVPRRSGASA